MSNLKRNAELMKQQTIGVEIEMGKISKQTACKIVSDYFRSTYFIDSPVVHEGRHHDNWACYGRPATGTTQPRKWQFMDDGSAPGDWGRITCEMVTPILHYDDIEDLQAIVRLLRENGARSGAHWNSGVHIHVGADFDTPNGQTTKSVINLTNLIASHQRFLCQALAVTPSRQRQWARFVEPTFLDTINGNRRPKNKTELERAWYGRTGYHEHYDGTRYHLLNLHAIWDKGTIEFRCFEFHNNLHAGELKAWIQLCLAMCSYVKLTRHCSPTEIDTSNQKYAMKNWLNNMGLIGDEFKTARKMLTKHLKGDMGSKVVRVSNLDDLDLDTRVDAEEFHY